MFSGWFARRRDLDRELVHWGVVFAVATVLCGVVGALVWFGYVALREWERGADLLLDRRQAEAVALTTTALNRDMEGAWSRVLVPINRVAVEEDPPYDLIQRTAQAFARFPYPESFFIWRHTESEPRGEVTYVFNRAERRPHWDHATESDDPFPVVVLRDPPAMRAVVTAVSRRAEPTNPFIVIEVDIGGVPYQVVAHLLFSPTESRLSSVAGFTVNLGWIRREYFGPLLQEVARIGGHQDVLSFSVTDDYGTLVTITQPPQQGAPGVQRLFPLLFLGSALVSSSSTPKPAIREWTVHVTLGDDQALPGTQQGMRETFAALVIASAVSAVALLLAVRFARASARLASVKSDFVSAVTHELKTPVALIRLVGDTLGAGHPVAPGTVKEYSRLLSREASRLSRAIENLLTYARYEGSRRHQPIELVPADVWDLVEQALKAFRPTLEQLEFEVVVDVPHDLPPVLADRAAMIQVLENVVANAIKYSEQVRALSIVGRVRARHVHLKISDQGTGIVNDDIARVFDRFYRGRNAKQGGSGLGLTIARRIIRHHGGDITLRSTLGRGTDVELLLAVAA